MAKIIAVVGATGSQGGGLVRAILADPSGGFTARAITRDPSKDKAKALAAAGAEVVSADLDNVESLKKAFAGAHGVFAVTNFWEHFSGEKEIAQAKNIAEAAKAAGVKHVIWSTLEDTRKLMAADDTRMPMLQGKYRVPHFDAKAEADAAFAGLPVTYPRGVVLLGQPLHLRSRAEEGRQGRLQLGVPDGHGQAGRHRRRGHRQGRVRDLQGRLAVHRQDHRHRRRDASACSEMSDKLRRASASPGAVQRRSMPTCSAASASRAPTNTATCSRSIATSRRRSTRLRSVETDARAQPGSADTSISGWRRTSRPWLAAANPAPAATPANA